MPLISGDFEDIGDVLTVQLSHMALVTGFSGYTETVTGESVPTKEFKRGFRYSVDGGYTFTVWTELTTPNLAAITADPLDLYYFEIRYERIGTDATGTMTWTFFNLTATVNLSTVTTYFPTIFTQPNVFGNFEVNDPTLQELCGNLLDKIKGYGIVPKYIERSEAYIHFWSVTCCFFALHYLIANRLANIYTDKSLLREYLLQRGVFLCGTETLVQLQDIASNYNEKMKNRGTQLVIPEIQRLICNCECCEFVFAFINKYEAGWVIDRASPLYRGGVRNYEAMNKFPEAEWGESIVDKNNYNLINGAGVSHLLGQTDNEGNSIDVLHIRNEPSMTGVGYNGTPDNLMTAKLDYIPPALPDPPVIDDWYLNYEMGFRMKMNITGAGAIGFGVDCFDCDMNLIPNATHNVYTGVLTSWFFRGVPMKQTLKYEHMFGILFGAYSQVSRIETNNGLGHNLIVNAAVAADIKYIYPKIVTEGAMDVMIYDIKAGVCTLPYSLSFIEVSNHIAGFFNNNNGQLSNAQVEERIKRYLIPINSQLNIVTLN